MGKILVLATAGLKAEQITDVTHQRYPRVDYLELQQKLDIDILNYSVYDKTRLGGLFRSLETQFHSDLYLSLLGWKARKKYDLVFAMSERAGIPYSGFLRFGSSRKPFVTMFQSWSWRQKTAIKNLSLFSNMDGIAVHCVSMKNHINELGVPNERIDVLPYSVDHKFFKPLPDVHQEPGLIVSVGETRSRDYASLMTAVKDLPLQLTVAASGSWYAREKNTRINTPIPENTIVTGHMSSTKLRDLYARSQFVVLPIYDTVYSAGATVIMEAGCMGRAVIATRSRGISDFIVDGETGIIVEPNNLEALREAIRHLIEYPEEAHRMGQNARQRVEEEFNLDIYVECMAKYLQRFL